jgi:hypothetical protein
MLIDAPANSCVNLKSARQGWQAWVAAYGQFDDGREVNWRGVNFNHKDRINKPIRYCITISETATEIESPDIEGVGYFSFKSD